MSAKRIVALVGRRDEPTDGVADYCAWLGGAMGRYGYEFETFRVDWLERGWGAALADLQEKAVAWHGCWVLLQFTTLAWSRRGFPLRAPRIHDALGKSGVHCGVVFHDFEPLGGSRWIDHARHYCQLRVFTSLYEHAERAIFTVPMEKILWLPEQRKKAVFIPVGANCPEPPPGAWVDTHGARTIAVYGVTGGTRTLPEVADISFAIKRASRAVGRLHVIVFGRGSREAESALRKEFAGADVEVETLGLLSPDDVSRTLVRADVMLFVRGQISSRRGSAIAGIACGLPVVCYAGPDTGWPIIEAGILPVPLGDREALSGALEKVLSDTALRNALCQRSRRAQEQYFSWRAIAARYADTLGGPGAASTSGLAVSAAQVLRTS
jgi:glycosyltransferase involved in cell wall biosynthesis